MPDKECGSATEPHFFYNYLRYANFFNIVINDVK